MKRLTYILTLALGTMTVACSKSYEDQEIKQLLVSRPVPIAFDTYVLQSAETRLPQVTALPAQGATGSIENVDRLRQVGFGVFAEYHERTLWSNTAEVFPNYMYDQQVTYDEQNQKWTYTPLKYWPNETTSDIHGATSDHTDYVSFFAYAPYVDYTAGATYETGNQITPADRTETHWGVVNMSDNFTNDKNGPFIFYAPASVSTNSVDLLWAVTPDNGFTYQPVNSNNTVTIEEGMPFLNIIKPAVDTKLTFQFKHALARLGVNVKADIGLWNDATVYTDELKAATKDNTIIAVDEVRITGNFPSSARLRLANTTAGVPLWENPTYDENTTYPNTHTYILDEQSIAPWLRTPEYVYKNNDKTQGLSDEFQEHIDYGVIRSTDAIPLLVQAKSVKSTEVRDDASSSADALSANLLSDNDEPTYLMVIPDPSSSSGTTLRVSITYSIICLDDHLLPTKNGYFRLTQTVDGQVSIPKMEAGKAYTLQCTIGLTTVLLEVNTYEWSEPITFGVPNVQQWTFETEEKKEFEQED